MDICILIYQNVSINYILYLYQVNLILYIYFFSAILKVKEDFFMYKSGVYSYSRIPPDNLPDDDKGYHSIRIIG